MFLFGIIGLVSLFSSDIHHYYGNYRFFIEHQKQLVSPPYSDVYHSNAVNLEKSYFPDFIAAHIMTEFGDLPTLAWSDSRSYIIVFTVDSERIYHIDAIPDDAVAFLVLDPRWFPDEGRRGERLYFKSSICNQKTCLFEHIPEKFLQPSRQGFSAFGRTHSSAIASEKYT